MRFTGKQVTTMVVAICAAAVLAPISAQAVGTAVNIVDAVTGSKAKVDAGKVRIGDGSGALTVDGIVAPAVPAKPLAAHGFRGPGTGAAFFKWGAGQVAVTDVVVSQNRASNVEALLMIGLYNDGGIGNCSSIGTPLDPTVLDLDVFVPPGETLTVNLSSPLVGRSGGLVCLRVGGDNVANLHMFYTVLGFDV